MKLITGGVFAGKYERLRALGFAPDEIADGRKISFEEAFEKPALNKLNFLIRRLLAAGKDPAKWILAQAALHPDIVIACDEVGCGVVPIEVEEREYREAVGRICCRLAGMAESVERVYCGLVTELKPEGNV